MEAENDMWSSGMKCESRKITWKIENFDVVRSSSELINSQKLTFEVGKSISFPTKWTYYLEESKGKEEGERKEREWIGVYLELADDLPDASSVQVIDLIQILKPDRKSAFFKDRDPVCSKYDTKGQSWGWHHVIKKHTKLNKLPLVDGCLIVELEVCIYVPKGGGVATLMKTLKATEDQYLAKFAKTLQQDLASLLESASLAPGNEAGSKIIARDEKEFNVHRCMLAARSPVFATMFQTAMKESETGIIRTPDLSSKTIAVLLRFLYNGTLHEDWSSPEVIVEFVYAAGKYQLKDLLEFLDLALGSVCTKETVGKLGILATKLSLKTAEKELLDFMKNHSSWEDMMSLDVIHVPDLTSD